MVLNRKSDEAIVPAVIELVRHFIARQDGLAVWLLAGDSDFADLVFRSRLDGAAADVARHEYRRQLPGVVDPILPESAGIARRVLDLIDGPNGLRVIVRELRYAVNERFNELAALRPATA